MNIPLFVGVDVGTASARAAIFDGSGAMLAQASQTIQIWRAPGGIVEQSSNDIWAAVCHCVRAAVADARIDPARISGIGFDATCSLVVIGRQNSPISVSASGDASRNVVVWMDHRATDQAAHVNAGNHPELRYLGGAISPEMQMPKLMWLHEHMPKTFEDADHFFDLADFLTWKATGNATRSLCTLSCKWVYLAHENRFSTSFLQAIGLGVLADERFARIGTNVAPPGTAIGAGLSQTAADDLGLMVGTAVAASLIDAHAGGVGSLGGTLSDGSIANPSQQIAYVFGTSACIMASGPDPVIVPGVWGPYQSAMIPGLWLSEGGQSAAGAAIDHLLRSHPAFVEANALANGIPLAQWLEHRISQRHTSLSSAVIDVAGLHIVPEFLGNRSPHADPGARATISGLTIEDDLASLERLYIAGLLGVAYGALQTIMAMRAQGMVLSMIVISGGAGKSPLVRQLLADATNMDVVFPQAAQPVLLGSAMLAAVAAGSVADLQAASAQMVRSSVINTPNPAFAAVHIGRYQAFTLLQDVERMVRSL